MGNRDVAKVYNKLYERLSTKVGEKVLYRLTKQRERQLVLMIYW